jgi:hypothetical protein
MYLTGVPSYWSFATIPETPYPPTVLYGRPPFISPWMGRHRWLYPVFPRRRFYRPRSWW